MALHALTVLFGSFLLFEVQPIAGKYLLPWFGGSPSVWTTCLLFFQFLLLGGYVYAHALTRRAPPRLQVGIHAVLLLLVLACLPVSFRPDRVAAFVGHPTLQALAALTFSIGLPFFLLSTTSPLLQSWATVGATAGRSPYRLYALSNAASLVAAATYPFLVEPTLKRATQARLWSLGVLVYVTLCLLTGWVTAQRSSGHQAAPPPAPPSPTASGATSPSRPMLLAWLGLPAISSLLLLAVTNKMTQDVAPVPFLWLLPLCLYLASWVVCFERPRWYARRWCVPAILVAVMAVAAVLFLRAYFSVQVQIGIHALALALCCVGCHGELARLQPPLRYLTLYYLLIGVGGFLGGTLVAVVAPLVFREYLEFQLGLCLCPLALLVAAFADPRSRLYRGRDRRSWAYLVSALLLIVLAFQQESARFSANRRYAGRSFYGTLAVYEFGRTDPQRHRLVLQNGMVIHGLQAEAPERRLVPTSCFGETSGVGLLLRHFRPEAPRRIGVLGLGIGTLTAYGKAGDTFRFYELNPDVETVARRYFTYLAATPAAVEVVLGDGRLCLEREEPEGFDVLVLDVFTSGAVPVHVLTREAFAAYRRHLKPDGVLAVNISNRHLDLEPVVLAIARDLGLHSAVIEQVPSQDQWWLNASLWALFSADSAVLRHPAIAMAVGLPVSAPKPSALWTDDHTALFPLLRHKLALFPRRVRPPPPGVGAAARPTTAPGWQQASTAPPPQTGPAG